MNEKIAAIQTVLGVTVDGIWGPKSQAALDAVIHPQTNDEHHVIASSFADPADVKAFNRCKAAGGTDQECFKVGDNGIGCWGDSTVEGTGPSCALPPERIKEKWGSMSEGKHKKVSVRRNDKWVICILKDRMPSIANLHNKAQIDLNPDACAALDLTPPVMAQVTWWWA